MAAVETLRALQLQRLQATVAHVYANNAHYRAAFDKAGIAPEDIRALTDISLLPFTTKADLRAHYPF